jgi:hypothetical protein
MRQTGYKTSAMLRRYVRLGERGSRWTPRQSSRSESNPEVFENTEGPRVITYRTLLFFVISQIERLLDHFATPFELFARTAWARFIATGSAMLRVGLKLLRVQLSFVYRKRAGADKLHQLSEFDFRHRTDHQGLLIAARPAIVYVSRPIRFRMDNDVSTDFDRGPNLGFIPCSCALRFYRPVSHLGHQVVIRTVSNLGLNSLPSAFGAATKVYFAARICFGLESEYC